MSLALSSTSTEALWAQLHQDLRQRLLRRVSQPDLVDDALQDTFLKVHDRIDELEGVDRVDRWVYRVAHNALMDRLRRERVRAGLPLESAELDLREQPQQGEDNYNQDVELWLRAFIELLPDTYREAVRLHEVEGLTQREVSDALGLSLSGAKSRIQRGRAELKRLLLDCCHIELDRRGNVVHVEARQRCCAGRTPLASTS